jgi:hypothetical protein
MFKSLNPSDIESRGLQGEWSGETHSEREEISDGRDLNIGARMVKKRQLELQPHSTCSNL